MTSQPRKEAGKSSLLAEIASLPETRPFEHWTASVTPEQLRELLVVRGAFQQGKLARKPLAAIYRKVIGRFGRVCGLTTFKLWMQERHGS